MKKPVKDLDYVELFAKKMKEDNSLFKEQKRLIESQMKANRSLIRNMFSENDFESEARLYLKRLGIIKAQAR